MPKFLSNRGGLDVIVILLVLASLVGGKLALDAMTSPVRATVVTTDPMVLTSGFADWAFCSHEQRVESHPNWFFNPKWGPAFVSGASGCGCSGGGTFNGNPQTAAMGFGLVPPNDIAAGNPGQLAPDGHDHPLVLANTGEVIYVETDFAIPGVGFDFRFTRFWRAGLPDLDRDFGPGWSHSCEIALRENTAGTSVDAFLGNGRVEDAYTWNATTSEWDSPAGFYDELEKFEPMGEDPYFVKTDKNGVVWTFDNYIDGTKDLFYCTKIEDPWGNEITFEYDVSNPHLVDTVTDTEGRELTFTRNGSLYVTQVTMSSTAIGDYGNVDIDYTYTSDILTKAEKTQTRLEDGGTKSRPYTEYTWVSSANPDDGLLNLVKDCGTTVLDFDYAIYDSTTPRCSKVTNADSEEYAYTYDVSSEDNSVTEDVTRYIDPYGQKQEFIYTDLSGGDRTIDGRRDFLEDETGADITTAAALTTFSRDCDCGRIDEIVYDDGSSEEWVYDTYGNVTKYTRVSSDGNDTDLVKQWTYDTFANLCRPLTSSGWLRAESNPSSKVEWDWNADGTLDTVTHPTVTSGQPMSQTIEWSYGWTDIGGGVKDGTLASITNPAGEKVGYTYSGDTITKTLDPDGGGLQLAYKNVRNVFGQTTQTEDPSGSTSQWDTTVTPDGRVLKVEGPNGQETLYEYNLRGFRIGADKLLEDSPSNRVETAWTFTSGGRLDSMTADSASGGIQALTDYEFDESSRYSQTIGADDYGSKSVFGYGSHNLPWKEYNLDDSGMTTDETLVQTIERDTMGRVVTVVDRGGHETDVEYDGFGRQTKVITDLPSSKTREVITTLDDDGKPEKVEIKVVGGGTTTYATTNYYYDQANRQYQTTQVDPESTLSDRTTKVERDEIGRVAIRVDELDSEWETQWDDAGRTSKTIDPVSNEIQYAYNVLSRTTTVTSHEYNTDTASFTDYVAVTTTDESGRTISIDNQGSASGSRKREFTYDEAGRRLSAEQEDGVSEWIITEWEYDDLGRQTKETVRIDASTDAITTTYWSAGGLKERVSDANAHNTRWTYNSFGQELTVEYDDSAAQTYTRTYDTSHGHLETITDPMGVEKTFVYDAADRVDYIDYNFASSGLDGPDRIDYTYDDMGRITAAKTQDYVSMSYTDLVSVDREYNGFGEMDLETQHGGHTITYTHFDNGAVRTITYPSGGPVVGVEYFLDDNGRVASVKRKLSTDVEGISTSVWETTAAFEYAGHREYERSQALYDLVRKQTYTSFREPDELTYKEASTSTLLTGLDSDWDDAGRMVVRERLHDIDGSTEMGEAFRYDDMGRLTKMWRELESPHSFTTTNPTVNFQDKVVYDIGKVYERDDVTITPVSGTPIEAIAVELNSLYQTTSHDSNSLTWDDNGQLTDYGTTKGFVWTGLGQLAEAQISGETDREYTYDAFGRRVSTTVGSQVNEFIYHGWHMVGEYDDTTGDWLWQEISMRGGERMLEHIALDTNDLDSDADATEYRPYAVHEDFQSTVWGLSDTDGDLLERYNYTDPYGESNSEDASASALGDYASAVFHRKRLHGGFVEKVSELYDFRNRWLDPVTGGWLSRDPLGQVDSENLHQAFRASPLVYVDSFGLSSEDCFEPKGSPDEEECPAGDEAAGLQEDSTLTKLAEENPFWGFFRDAGMYADVRCACNQCRSMSPLDNTRKAGEYIAGTNIIWIMYKRQVKKSESSGLYGRTMGLAFQAQEPTQGLECCPCEDQSETVHHELLHYMLSRLGLRDGHDNPGTGDDVFDETARAITECLDGTSSSCQTAANELAELVLSRLHE